MYFKNLQTIFTFITFALLALSSPVRYEKKDSNDESIEIIEATSDIKSLTEKFSITEFEDQSYGFLVFVMNNYFNQPLNDEAIVDYAMESLGYNATDIMFKLQEIGCSAFSTPNKEGNGYYFGRNYNSEQSNTLIMVNHSEKFYSSISTVNIDFINQVTNSNVTLPDVILKTLALVSPLDGMNEKGLSVSVSTLKNIPNNQSPDFPEVINQTIDTKFNVTTTSLVRLLLDNASSADEAIKIINVVNLYGSSDMNVHYVISDATGKTYVVEYIHNEAVVTEASVATDFYVAEGEYNGYGIGLERYNTINEIKSKISGMNTEEIKNALASVKENTQWSVIYDLLNKEATYYLNENYDHGFKVKLNYHQDVEDIDEDKDFEQVEVDVGKDIKNLTDGLMVTEFKGDDGIDAVLEKGYFENEEELFNFILDYMNLNITVQTTDFEKKMACSAFSVQNEEGSGYYFGRNYDFPECEGLILVNHPTNGYSSISTVDTDFIGWIYDKKTHDQVREIINGAEIPKNPKFSDEVFKALSLYLPLDGVNEKGLSISVNAVSGDWNIVQMENAKYKFTTFSAIRAMLDKAATVDEAVELLKKANMHFVFDLHTHFIISDASGKTVTVEYSDENIYITETSVVTNSYISDSEKFKYMYKDRDILFDKRYDTLLKRISDKPNQSPKDARNTLRSAIQSNTQWSIIYDQSNLEATYFNRRNFDIGYHVRLFEENSESSDEEETLYFDEDDIKVIEDDNDDKDGMTEIN